MITPEDLRSDKIPSGYKYVTKDGNKWRVSKKVPFGTKLGNGVLLEKSKRTRLDGSQTHAKCFRIYGLETPYAAAKAYCDWHNAYKLTVEDLRTEHFIGGFKGVEFDHRRSRPFRGRYSVGGNRDVHWRGPTRSTALEAAQDYCDYVNSQKNLGTTAPRTSVALTNADHPVAPRKKNLNPKVAEGLALIREGRQAETKEGWVYCIAEEANETFVKIGKSADEPMYRLAGLQTGNPRKLRVLGQIHSDNRHALEKSLHSKYIEDNVLGEWFRATPALLKEFGL